MNRNLMLSILAMDSYNRGYGLGINGLAENGQIGTASIGFNSSILRDSNQQRLDVPASFYAIAYSYNGETVISYRGTDNFAVDNRTGYGVGIGIGTARQAQHAVKLYNRVAA